MSAGAENKNPSSDSQHLFKLVGSSGVKTEAWGWGWQTMAKQPREGERVWHLRVISGSRTAVFWLPKDKCHWLGDGRIWIEVDGQWLPWDVAGQFDRVLIDPWNNSWAWDGNKWNSVIATEAPTHRWGRPGQFGWACAS